MATKITLKSLENKSSRVMEYWGVVYISITPVFNGTPSLQYSKRLQAKRRR
jgi:hypothetical protein